VDLLSNANATVEKFSLSVETTESAEEIGGQEKEIGRKEATNVLPQTSPTHLLNQCRGG
jgi:hypothetical protein